MKRRILTILLVASLLTACNQNDDSSANEKKDTKPYPEDGYMGMTYANPNLPTNPTYHSYSKDVLLMSRTLNRIEGVEYARFYLNGTNVTVFLRLVPSKTRLEQEKIRQKVHQVLTMDFPRYHFEIQ